MKLKFALALLSFTLPAWGANDYYNHGSFPVTGSQASSADMRAELDLIQAGFVKLPTITGNNSKAVIVNSGATALTVTTGTLALAGNFATTGAYNTTLIQGGTTSLTLPTSSATLAILGAQTFTGLQTFGAGISVPTGFNVTGAGTAQVTGFATVSATNLAGTLTTAAQANVTSLGTLTGLTVTAAPTFSFGTATRVPFFGTAGLLSDSSALTYVSGTGTLSATTFSGAFSGNATTATALAANGANCSAGSFPLGVDASGASETCTALPTTITGTSNQITASASTGAITLSIPTNPTLPGTTTGTFSGNISSTSAGPQATFGQNATTLGSIKLYGNTSGDATIQPAAAAGTATVLTLPATTGTLALTSGNVATATALASDPSDCAANNFAITIAASGNLTCAQPSISAGVSGLGTGVATALAVNVGSAGAFVVNGGALGTPSSGTVTNLTGTFPAGVDFTSKTGTGTTWVTGTGPTISSPIITNIAPGANFTLTQNSVVPFTSENTGAVVNTLYLKTGNVGIGMTAPTNKLEIALPNDGTLGMRIAGPATATTNSWPAIEVIGSRSDGNTTFFPRYGAGYRRTDGTAIANGQALGVFAFGGQWGTDTALTESKLLYAAGIVGVAEGNFTAAAAMPTAIVFNTGSTGSDLHAIGQSFGTERMRITSTGIVSTSSTTDATSSTAASVTMAGGLAVKEKIWAKSMTLDTTLAVTGTVDAGGGSSGKAMCWKTATRLGYCSSVVDVVGACTCN